VFYFTFQTFLPSYGTRVLLTAHWLELIGEIVLPTSVIPSLIIIGPTVKRKMKNPYVF
jgi:hypothetical protein